MAVRTAGEQGRGGERILQALVGFAGFGGVEIALREFGFEVVGVEIEEAIAAVNRLNGGHCLTADLLAVDPLDYVGWWLMHFSPPCPSFSVAKQGGETEMDLMLARKICEFISVAKPVFFTLENVWGYRKSLSWLLIWYTLLEEGYGVEGWNINAADYGVPQTRRRMIVIARRDGRRPAKPWPTRSQKPDMFTMPWVGWYEAIKDLLPGLPETRFADWQMAAMPEKLRTWLVGHSSINLSLADPADPAFTVTAHSQRMRDFLLGQGNLSYIKGADQPADTITANSNQTGIKAFVANSQNTNRELTVRASNEPIFTVAANALEKNSPPGAFLVGRRYQTPNGGGKRYVQNVSGDRPVWTITASEHLGTRAWLDEGRVVLMTPRALARFQDFPDWFQLPDNRALACRGIGNALPPGVYRAVLRSLGYEQGDQNAKNI